MRRFTQLAFAILTLGFLCSCSKEEPNPEERDPIYQDLVKRQSEQQKAFEEATKSLESLREKLPKADPNSPERRDLLREIAKNQRIVLVASQLAHYFKIRTERRKVVDKLVYKEAFYAHKEWPEPREYSDYMVNRRLTEANRNWGVRVPKLTDRIPSSSKPQAKENVKSEKKEE